MEFIRFDSIKHLDGYEVSFRSSFSEDDFVVITEKLDGGNVSITSEYISTRNGPIPPENESLSRGWFEFGTSIQTDQLLEKYILFGEWLVPHIVKYKEEALSKFYLFSVVDKETKEEMPWRDVVSIASSLGIQTPPVLFQGLYSEIESKVESFVGMSTLTADSDGGEGIVIRNETKGLRVKIVQSEFQERHRLGFASERLEGKEYFELWLLEYGTHARVRKVFHKLLDEYVLAEGIGFSEYERAKSTLLEYTLLDMIEETEGQRHPIIEEEHSRRDLHSLIVKVDQVLKEYLQPK